MAHPSAILSVLVNADTAAATANLTKYDRQLQAVNDSARNGIETRLGATVDSKGFDEYQAKLAKTAQMAKDRAAFKAELGANFNPAAFQAYQRAVDAARRQAAKAVDVQVSIKDAVARLNELQTRMGKVPDKISIKADVDTGVAETKLNILQAKIRETERQAAAADLGLGGGGGGGGGFLSRVAGGFSGGVPGLGPLAVGAGAAPLIAGGLGAATAVAGSAGAATLGAGAVGAGAAGIGAAGLGPILALSGGLKDATKLSTQLTAAQDKLSAAQQLFGDKSKQAAAAQLSMNKLIAANDPAVVKLAKSFSALDDVMSQAEQSMLPAFTKALTPIVDTFKNLLPTIQQMAKIDLSGISKGLAPLLQFLQGSTFKTALLDLSHAFAQLAPVVIGASLNLLKAFLSVATAAAPYVIEIAKAFERWTASFAKSAADGPKLQGLIAYLVSQLHSWFDLAVSISRIMITIFKAGAIQGKGLVDKLTVILDHWNKWLNTRDGQAAMTKFFSDSARLLGAVLSTLAPVVKLIASMSVGLIPAMTTLLRPLATILASISQWVNGLSKDLPPVLNALPGLGVAVGVLAGWKALQAVVSATAASIVTVAKSKLPGAAAGAAEGGAAAGAGAAGAGAAGGASIGLLPIAAGAVAVTAGLVALSRAIHGDGGVNADLQKMQTNLRAAIAAGDVPKIHALTDMISGFGNKLADVGGKGAGQFKALAAAGNAAADRITKSFGTMSTKISEVAPLFKTMAGDAGLSLKTIQTQATSSASAIASTLGNKSTEARVAIATNFSIAAKDIRASMQAGVVNTGQGMKAIADMLAKALSALGGKPLAVSNFLADVGPGVVTAQQLVASGNLSPGGVASPHAIGGLVQVGRAGQKGHDTVPMTVGGANIVVGAGEQVAVFNSNQIPEVNARFADVGGLPGFFTKNKKPNYMASGGLIGPRFAGGGTLSYGQLEGLWDKAGGPQSLAPLMAAIAMAESGGRDVMQAGQPFATTGWGYWQITPGGPQYLDPMTNAREAVAKYNSQGLNAWTTYTSGAYRQFLQGNIPPSAGGFGGVGGLSQISAPTVKGGGAVTGVVRGALGKGTAAANAFLRRQAAAMAASAGAGGAAGVGTGGPAGGLGMFDGMQVASWIIPELLYAQSHGWRGRITSGYRPGFDPHAPSGSEHALTRYPGGAVDFGGMVDPAGGANRAAFMAATAGYKGLRLIPATGFRDDGHMSGTGHTRGGLIARNYAGAFADGGMVTATSPTMAMFGDNGPETALFLPRAKGFAAGGSFTGGTGRTGSGFAFPSRIHVPTSIATSPIARIIGMPGLPTVPGNTPTTIAGARNVAGTIGGMRNQISALSANYGTLDQFFNLNPPVLVDPNTGVVDTNAVNTRLAQLARLAAIRQHIFEIWGRVVVLTRRLVAANRMIIATLNKKLAANVATVKMLQANLARISTKGLKGKALTAATALKASTAKQIAGAQAIEAATRGDIAKYQGNLSSAVGDLTSATDSRTSSWLDVLGVKAQVTGVHDTVANAALATTTAAATPVTAAAPTGPSTAETLLQGLLTASQQATAVSEAQFSVLKGAMLPPFGGSFATGGVVPGPAGSPRTIIAHGGETVSNGQPVVNVNFGPGMEWLRQFMTVELEQAARPIARRASRGLPGSR